MNIHYTLYVHVCVYVCVYVCVCIYILCETVIKKMGVFFKKILKCFSASEYESDTFSYKCTDQNMSGS